MTSPVTPFSHIWSSSAKACSHYPPFSQTEIAALYVILIGSIHIFPIVWTISKTRFMTRSLLCCSIVFTISKARFRRNSLLYTVIVYSLLVIMIWRRWSAVVVLLTWMHWCGITTRGSISITLRSVLDIWNVNMYKTMFLRYLFQIESHLIMLRRLLMEWRQVATIARSQLPYTLCLVTSKSSFLFLCPLPILLSYSLFSYDRSSRSKSRSRRIDRGGSWRGRRCKGRSAWVKNECFRVRIHEEAGGIQAGGRRQ